MPGKYSHNLVLSQYSSQGIISLPNGQQLDCLKAQQQHRVASALSTRQPALTDATSTSAQRSIATKSAQSVPDVPRPRRYNLTTGEIATPRRRVVIIDSSSEEECVVVKPCIKAQAQAPSTSPLTLRRGYGSAPRPATAHASSRPTVPATWHTRPESNLESPKPQSQSATGPSVVNTAPNRPKSRAGVKAFIHARYIAEAAVDQKSTDRSTEKREGHDAEATVSIRDFLKDSTSKRQARPARGVKANEGNGLSLREFMEIMPSPEADNDADSEHSLEGPILPCSSSTPGGPVAPPLTSKAHRRYPKGSCTYAHKLDEAQRRDCSPKLYLDGFDDREDQRHYVGTSALPLRAQMGREKPQITPSNAKLPKREPVPDVPKVFHHIETTKRSGRRPSKDEADERLRTLPPRKDSRKPLPPLSSDGKPSGVPSRTSGYANTHSHGPSQADSVSSYRSDHSSMFGLSSMGQTTATSSRLSPNSQATSKRGTPHSWRLAHIDQVEESDDELGDILTDTNDTSLVFTSDEEDQDDRDRPAPRLQTSYGGAHATRREWGMISAGKEFTRGQKDSDQMSEISAVYPPDIGRYKYGGEGGPHLAMALRGIPEESEGARNSSGIKGDKLRKGSGGSGNLLGRLRIKRNER